MYSYEDWLRAVQLYISLDKRLGLTIRQLVGYPTKNALMSSAGAATTGTPTFRSFLADAHGSTYAVLDDFGMPINAHAKMAFDPWGVRRKAEQWNAVSPWSGALRSDLLATTRKGYTGHEQLDGVGIIHMGGRIYAPELGRFLQAGQRPPL